MPGASAEGPVADDFAAQEEDRPEVACVVMCPVTMVWVKGYVAAFITDQVFVVGREEVDAVTAVPTESAVSMIYQIEAIPSFLDQFFAQ